MASSTQDRHINAKQKTMHTPNKNIVWFLFFIFYCVGETGGLRVNLHMNEESI